MKKSLVVISLIACVVAAIVQLYLTTSWINLHYGMSGSESFCNLNATFNCDAVSVSNFSHIQKIPIAAFAFFYHIVLIMFLLAYRFSESQLAYRLSYYLAAGSVLASVVMGFVSTFLLTTYCLFCIFAYLLSVIIFICLHKVDEDVSFKSLQSDINEILNNSKAYLFSIIAIPVGAFILSDSLAGEGKMQSTSYALNVVGVWERAPKFDFSSEQDSFSYGSVSDKEPLMEIVEFADFFCGHCKHAANPLHSFAQSRPGVKLRFFHFPLDSNCNPVIQRPGKSCQLAYASFCAEKIAQKGSAATMFLFQKQGQISPSNVVETLGTQLNIDTEQLRSCVELPETKEAVQKQAELGTKAGVQGTPSIYINGRPVRGAQMIPVLDALYRYIASTKN